MTYAEREGGGFTLLLQGASAEDATDDIQVLFDSSGNKEGLVLAETAILEEALGLIDAYWKEQDRLPLTVDGTAIVGTLKDPCSLAPTPDGTPRKADIPAGDVPSGKASTLRYDGGARGWALLQALAPPLNHPAP